MKIHKLDVLFHERKVGTLSETYDHRVAFAYTPEWIEHGFPISPFSLPVSQQVLVPTGMYFGGLYGVFGDSLPDAWGQLLMRRMLQQHGLEPDQVTPMMRLAVIGDTGLGALCYRPAWDSWNQPELEDLDALAEECRKILNHEEPDDVDYMFALAGSSGGTQPKVMTREWIMKFPASSEDPDCGIMEKAYMDCAQQCGIIVPETRLLPSRRCSGHFAARRFDRTPLPDGSLQRVHMLTVAAILELDWRAPSLDYHALMKLTRILCRDRKSELEQMFRRMCFNVFAHNRDDHSKNFSFLYHEETDQWTLSPAYDLTFSSTYYGEHTTSVDGNGRNPGLKEILSVGKKAGLSAARCRQIAEEIYDKAAPLASKFRNFPHPES